MINLFSLSMYKHSYIIITITDQEINNASIHGCSLRAIILAFLKFNLLQFYNLRNDLVLYSLLYSLVYNILMMLQDFQFRDGSLSIFFRLSHLTPRSPNRHSRCPTVNFSRNAREFSCETIADIVALARKSRKTFSIHCCYRDMQLHAGDPGIIFSFLLNANLATRGWFART